MIKRAVDLIAAAVGLILLAPVMAVIGVLVRRDSEGPVLFRQERIGRDGRPFTLLKFRSMSVAPVPSGPLVTTATDARVTRIGVGLRATKLDELPQLINVIRGDMSIVGPRPEVPEYAAMWTEEQRRTILSVRPGITDPATIRARRESEELAKQEHPEVYYREVLLPQKAGQYCEYVRTRSFLGDAQIILRTLHSIVRE